MLLNNMVDFHLYIMSRLLHVLLLSIDADGDLGCGGYAVLGYCLVGGYTVTNWMWGDKEGGRERAPDSRTQGEAGLSACIGGLLATWRRMGVLGVYWLQACTETEEGSVRIHGLHGDSGCVGYAILGYCEVGGHATRAVIV